MDEKQVAASSEKQIVLESTDKEIAGSDAKQTVPAFSEKEVVGSDDKQITLNDQIALKTYDIVRPDPSKDEQQVRHHSETIYWTSRKTKRLGRDMIIISEKSPLNSIDGSTILSATKANWQGIEILLGKPDSKASKWESVKILGSVYQFPYDSKAYHWTQNLAHDLGAFELVDAEDPQRRPLARYSAGSGAARGGKLDLFVANMGGRLEVLVLAVILGIEERTRIGQKENRDDGTGRKFGGEGGAALGFGQAGGGGGGMF